MNKLTLLLQETAMPVSNGKSGVVTAVLCVIFAVIVVYLIVLDRRMKKAEKGDQ